MKSEMTSASFCCGLIVGNKSKRLLISNRDSEDVAFIKKKKGPSNEHPGLISFRMD